MKKSAVKFNLILMILAFLISLGLTGCGGEDVNIGSLVSLHPNNNDGQGDCQGNPILCARDPEPEPEKLQEEVQEKEGGIEIEEVELQAPIAEFRYSTTFVSQVSNPYGPDGCNYNVELDARNSKDPDGEIISYRWIIHGDYAHYYGEGSYDMFEESSLVEIHLGGICGAPDMWTVTLELEDSDGLKTELVSNPFPIEASMETHLRHSSSGGKDEEELLH